MAEPSSRDCFLAVSSRMLEPAKDCSWSPRGCPENRKCLHRAPQVERGSVHLRWVSKGLLGGKVLTPKHPVLTPVAEKPSCTFWRAQYCKGRKEEVDIVLRREGVDMENWRTKSKVEGKSSTPLKKCMYLCKITCIYKEIKKKLRAYGL